VFFELNGQPRTVKVANHKLASTARVHPRAEEGNPGHVPAPMPGMVVSVAVQPGQKVERGDTLLSIEAMKMETAIHAERDGTVETVHASVGMRVDAHDLLMVVV
jgi:pyruvate carboxylase